MAKKKEKPRRPTEEQLLDILKNIESGKITIALDKQASAGAVKRENGIYHYDTSNKWRIGVFVDCGRFDYIDYMQHGGTIVNYTILDKYYPEVYEFAKRFTDKELAKKVWGIEAKIFANLQGE